MDLFNAISSAKSGINNNTKQIENIGHNLANLNTTAFKSTNLSFQQELIQSCSGSNKFHGSTPNLEVNTEQGDILSSQSELDLAISGKGYFVLEGTGKNSEEHLLSRNGSFHVNEDGYLVDNNNLKLQGQTSTEQGDYSNDISGININDISNKPQMTSGVKIILNLDNQSKIIPSGFSTAQPEETSNYSYDLNLYDSKGKDINAKVYFTKTGDDVWEWNGVVDGKELEGGTEGENTVVFQGALTFNTDGSLNQSPQIINNFNPKNGTNPQKINFSFAGDNTSESTTSYNSETTINNVKTDGYKSQDIDRIFIDENGKIKGSNAVGRIVDIGRITLATPTSEKSLTAKGNGLYFSKDPIIYNNSGENGAGNVLSKSLEGSNVDIAKEFVSLIVAQRNYQANMKSITTSDQILMEIMSLKK